MGNRLASDSMFYSLFPCLSRDSKTENINDDDVVQSLSFLKDNEILSSESPSIGSLVPERYLVLLTEQMTEMLFRLINCSDNPDETNSEQRVPLGFGLSPLNSSPISSNLSTPRSSFQWQPIHQSCLKCQMKMLTIEEFHQLHKAFRHVDRDHDHFLTRDEIRTTLHHLFQLTETDIKEIISVFDTNKDDRISLKEYIEEMKHRLLHEFTREEIKIAFDQADTQQNGHLRVEELKNAIAYLNLHLPNRQIVEIVNDCLKNQTTQSIDFLAFNSIIRALHRCEPITLKKFKPIHRVDDER